MECSLINHLVPDLKNYKKQQIQIENRNGCEESLPDYQIYAFFTSCSWKVYFMFEELNLTYQNCLVNLREMEHYKGEFAEMSPNNKIPMLIDNSVDDGEGESLQIFESGAILLYMAEKYNKYLPPLSEPRKRSQVQQWLSWQISEMSPFIATYVHFHFTAPSAVPLAMEKAEQDALNILKVLDKRLDDGREYICNEYSIADIACFGWGCYIALGVIPGWDKYQNLKRWINTMTKRPAISKFLPKVEHTLKVRQLRRLDNNEYVIPL